MTAVWGKINERLFGVDVGSRPGTIKYLFDNEKKREIDTPHEIKTVKSWEEISLQITR